LIPIGVSKRLTLGIIFHTQNKGVSGWIVREATETRPNLDAVVARRGDKRRRGVGVLQGRQHEAGLGVRTEAHVQHRGAVVGRVADSFGNGGCVANPCALEHLDGHDLGVPTSACNANLVVCDCGGNACHVGAVKVVIKGRIVGVDEVPAVKIVDVSVAVVVVPFDAIDLGMVHPCIGCQIRVVVIHA